MPAYAVPLLSQAYPELSVALARLRRNGPRLRRTVDRLPVNPYVQWLFWGLTLGLLLWFGWSGAATRAELRAATSRAVRVAEMRSSFTYLNETLTMSTRLAVATGDPAWVARYDETLPRLDALIQEAEALATPEVRTALRATTGESSQGLAGMSQAAFNLSAAGDRPAAAALLNGPEFDYLESVYASGIAKFGEDLAMLAAQSTQNLDRRAWTEAATLGVGAMLLLAAGVSQRGRTRLAAALAHTELIARTDPLTDLPNRRRLNEALHTALTAERPTDGLALLAIDLDRFKAVNDAYGHKIGDRLLQLAAARLKQAARSTDMVARVGEDEFTILVRFERQPDPAMWTEQAADIAGRVIAVLSQPFELGPYITPQLSASVGVVVRAGSDGTIDEVLLQADAALIRAKQAGRGCFRFSEQGMDLQIKAQALLGSDLRQAIRKAQIEPYFQPLVCLLTGKLTGFEMLARWRHPTRGFVSPAEFIPMSETAGLIGDLTETLLRQACYVARDWPATLMLACNISPLQLRSGSLARMIASVLRETGMPGSRLELEITESALLEDIGSARTVLTELKGMGMTLALDDFGTGYSSLRHLQALPFDKLKIDAGFVGAMTKDPESRKIVAAVIGLGRSLGLHTVAEGVEDAETARLITALGGDIGQGWFYGRPTPHAAATALVEQSGKQNLEFLQPACEAAGLI